MTEAVSYALVCGLALSALLVPVTALAMRRATGLGGGMRHTIWFLVLLATVAATVAAIAVSVLRPAQQFSGVVVPAAAPVPATAGAAAAPLAALCAIFLACWLVVAFARTFVVARRVVALRAVKHRATPMDFDCDLPRGARTLASESCVPAAVGFLHPAILLPSGTMEALDPEDARQIVLHEAAHLRRGDDLTGLVFLLCAALFWFNPFVHYIGRKLSLECEIACDDAVVEQSGDAERYATLLFEIAERSAGTETQLAWNGFVHPSDLVTRIHNLLHGDPRRRALPWPALAALMGVLLSGAGLAAFNAPALGRAGDDASVRVIRPVHRDAPAPDQRVVQYVRAFPPCKVHGAPGERTAPRVHGDSKPCEATAAQITPSTRVKKGTATP
jgi:beta-lactamase regulating signal transducer with metallopeptidase domain